jgi:putative tryptophan/tyrosine transport system substrate-binding protein
MRRREFISLLGGVAATWPLAARAALASEASGQRGDSKVRAPDTRPEPGSSARAQPQPERMRRIGVLMNVVENDPQGQARRAVFVQRLKELGWIEGRNVRFDFRGGAGEGELYRQYATELVALAPDVIFTNASATVAVLQQVTRTQPIVFATVIDPVGGGMVESLARPGGNTTGFIAFEYAIGAKWLELLKEIAPGVTRAAILRDPAIAAGIGQFAAIQAAGPIGMELSVISTRGDAGAVENAVAAFARRSNGGLVVTGSPFAANNVGPIAALAARHKLPTVYPFRYFVSGGGLISYGPDLADQFRNAAGYVDRILRGEKPEDLPVQAPTKYELVVNLKTAKTLGLDVPPTLLARADEVIE